jgi:hypothetical protein
MKNHVAMGLLKNILYHHHHHHHHHHLQGFGLFVRSDPIVDPAGPSVSSQFTIACIKSSYYAVSSLVVATQQLPAMGACPPGDNCLTRTLHSDWSLSLSDRGHVSWLPWKRVYRTIA